MPIGLLRPSSATAMPRKPSPAVKSVVYECVFPRRSGRPISPATAPESSIVLITIVRAFTPLALAADGDIPLAMRSNPNRVRLSRTAITTPTTTAMIRKPYNWRGGLARPKRSKIPLRPGIWPDAGISAVAMIDAPSGLPRNGPVSR